MCKALDAGFDFLAGDHHQIRHLVDDHHDERHGLGHDFLGFEDRFSGCFVKTGLHGSREHLAFGQGVFDPTVVAFDVAHAHLGHLAIAFLHFADDPFQRHDRLFGVGDNGAEEVRDAVINAEFEHLGVDHDQAAFLGRKLVEERQNHGVDRDRFAGPGGACNQEVGHLGEICDDWIAANVLAQCKRQSLVAVAVVAGRQDFPQ